MQVGDTLLISTSGCLSGGFGAPARYGTWKSGPTGTEDTPTQDGGNGRVQFNLGDKVTFTATAVGNNTGITFSTELLTVDGFNNPRVFITVTADTTAPTLSSSTPTDNATNVDFTGNIVLTFSESVKAGTGNIVLKKSSDNSTVATIPITNAQITISGSVVTINPTSNLDFSTSYYVEIASGVIQDLADNAFAGISGVSTLNFTTASELIYDFQAADYNATTGQWPNTRSISETVTVSKKGGSSTPVKNSAPNSVSFVDTDEHQFITSDDRVYGTFQAFTIAAWFKTSTAGTTGRKIVGFEQTRTAKLSGGYDRMLWVGNDGLLYFGARSSDIVKSSNRVDNGDWQYAVATYTNPTMRLYLNGTEVATKTATSATAMTGYWRIGGYRATGWPAPATGNLQDGFFPGSIGQVSIYERGIDSTAVSTLHSDTRSTYLGLTPTFGTPTATADGFTVQISNYNAAYTWSGTATASGSVSISDTGHVTVTGVAPLTSSTATITTTRTGYSNRTATVSETSTTGGALTPTFGAPTSTADGFTASIINYDAAFTWATPTVSAGSVAITSTTGATRVLTVTGLSLGATATITQNTSRTGYSDGTATVSGTAAVAAQSSAADNSAAQAEAARKAREQRELTEILALIPKIGGLTLSLGEKARALTSTRCVKGKTTKFVKKGAKCPKGFVRKR